MVIKIMGKAHPKGHSKRTGNDYDFLEFHYMGKKDGVIGDAALQITCNPSVVDFNSVVIGGLYDVEYGPTGRGIGIVGIHPVKA